MILLVDFIGRRDWLGLKLNVKKNRGLFYSFFSKQHMIVTTVIHEQPVEVLNYLGTFIEQNLKFDSNTNEKSVAAVLLKEADFIYG